MNNFFQFSDKKATCLKWTEIKVSQIPRNRELNWIFLSVSSKRTIFLKTVRQQSFFLISFCSFKSTILFSRTLHLFFQVTVCNQPIVVLRHLKRYGTGTVKPYSTFFFNFIFPASIDNPNNLEIVRLIRLVVSGVFLLPPSASLIFFSLLHFDLISSKPSLNWTSF